MEFSCSCFPKSESSPVTSFGLAEFQEKNGWARQSQLSISDLRSRQKGIHSPETLLRAFLSYHALDPKLDYQQFLRHPLPVPPPQVGDVLNKIKGAKGKFPGIWIIILIIILIYIGSSTFYTIGVDEVGIIQRFGRYIQPPRPPGLHFKLPRGIEKVTKVKVRFVYKEEFGLRTIQAGVRTRYAAGSAYLSESLMLTGDLNVAVVMDRSIPHKGS